MLLELGDILGGISAEDLSSIPSTSMKNWAQWGVAVVTAQIPGATQPGQPNR